MLCGVPQGCTVWEESSVLHQLLEALSCLSKPVCNFVSSIFGTQLYRCVAMVSVVQLHLVYSLNAEMAVHCRAQILAGDSEARRSRSAL